MKKLVFLSLMVSLSCSSLAAIGYVNTQQVFQNYSKTKSYSEVLNKNKVEVEKKLAAKDVSLKNKQEEILKKGTKATAKEKSDLQKEIIDFKKQVLNEQEKYRKDDIAKTEEVRHNIKLVVDAIYKTGKYEAIVDSSVIMAGGVNLTEKVSETLEKNFKK